MRSSRPTRWARAGTFRAARGTPLSPGATADPASPKRRTIPPDGCASARRWPPTDRGRRCHPKFRTLRGLRAPRRDRERRAAGGGSSAWRCADGTGRSCGEPAGQNPEICRRTFAAPARLVRPQCPLPAIPEALDLPYDAQVAAQFGEHFRVEVLNAFERVGGEPVGRLELLVALAAHQFPVLAALVDWRIDDQKAAARPQATADFGERAAVAGGVVYGRVVAGHVQAARGQGQIVELRVDPRKGRVCLIVAAGGEAVQRIAQDVDRDGLMAA